MILKIKLTNASYAMHVDGNAMTVDVSVMSEATDSKPAKLITSTLGYYGPAQVDLAIERIIKEELTQTDEVVNLRRFLELYKGIHEIIAPQLVELKDAIREQRLKTT
jgi:hypothetical protein